MPGSARGVPGDRHSYRDFIFFILYPSEEEPGHEENESSLSSINGKRYSSSSKSGFF